MTFLNALLAFGATAFAVPLIIHLLNRSKYLTIDWGAMEFLDSSVKVNSRRIQWKQLLLLLVRCLIPILLALAMARPLVQTWKDASGTTPMSLAVLLDDSLSMQSIDQQEAILKGLTFQNIQIDQIAFPLSIASLFQSEIPHRQFKSFDRRIDTLLGHFQRHPCLPKFDFDLLHLELTLDGDLLQFASR